MQSLLYLDNPNLGNGNPIVTPLCCREPVSGHGYEKGCCMVIDLTGKDAQGGLLHNSKVWHDPSSLLLHSLLMTPVLQESNCYAY